MEDIQHKVAALSCFNDPQDVTALAGGLTNVNILVHDGGRKYVVRFGDDIPQHAHTGNWYQQCSFGILNKRPNTRTATDFCYY